MQRGTFGSGEGQLGENHGWQTEATPDALWPAVGEESGSSGQSGWRDMMSQGITQGWLGED